MNSLFNLYPNTNQILLCLILTIGTFVISLLFSSIVSIKLRSTKSFFLTLIILPMIVSAVISIMSIFLSDTTSSAVRIVTIAVALGLIRFRSTNGRAEEIMLLFAGVAVGLISGLGYILFSLIFSLVVALLFVLLSNIKLFDSKKFKKEKLLKITVPESLEFDDMFNDTFNSYLKKNELVEVKTIDMGSMFRLSYVIELKDIKTQKEFIDELRTKNGNLEISILPYALDDDNL